MIKVDDDFMEIFARISLIASYPGTIMTPMPYTDSM